MTPVPLIGDMTLDEAFGDDFGFFAGYDGRLGGISVEIMSDNAVLGKNLNVKAAKRLHRDLGKAIEKAAGK